MSDNRLLLIARWFTFTLIQQHHGGFSSMIMTWESFSIPASIAFSRVTPSILHISKVLKGKKKTCIFAELTPWTPDIWVSMACNWTPCSFLDVWQTRQHALSSQIFWNPCLTTWLLNACLVNSLHTCCLTSQNAEWGEVCLYTSRLPPAGRVWLSWDCVNNFWLRLL